MTLTTESGAPKISKLTEKLKFLQCLADPVSALLFRMKAGGASLLILAVFVLKPLELQALPVSIGWQVPLTGSHAYQLEVASDPKFGTIVLNAAATGRSYNWEAPSEGVYHWRLLRIGKTGATEEASTFVSGSFIAVDPGVQRVRPARITWEPVSGADRYKLYAVDKNGTVKTMLALSNSFVLPKTEFAVMIELVPYSGENRRFREFHYNPSLKWEPGTDAPVAAAPAVAPAPAEIPAEPAPVTEAPAVAADLDEPEPAVTTESTDTDNAHRRRVYQLSFFLFHGQEKLRLQKLEVLFSSLERVSGGGASVWINPVSGLVVSGSGWYHEHKGDVSQKSLFGDKKMKIDQSRYLVEFQMGWNLLHWTDLHNQMLTLSFVAAAAQLPFMPLEYDAALGKYPELTKKQVSMPGASIGYSWLSTNLGITVDGGVLKEKSDEVDMGYQRLVFDYFRNERLSMSVGFYNRFIQSVRCHSSSATCLKEGKVTTTSEERGIYAGVGAVFF